MNDLDGRITKLEQRENPKEEAFFVVEFDPETGKAGGMSSPELVGMVPAEVDAFLEAMTDRKITLFTVVHDSRLTGK